MSLLAQNLAYSMLHTFDAGHGWFFWNFRTELEVSHYQFLVIIRQYLIGENISLLISRQIIRRGVTFRVICQALLRVFKEKSECS